MDLKSLAEKGFGVIYISSLESLLIEGKIIIFDFYYLFIQFMGKNYRNCILSSYRRFLHFQHPTKTLRKGKN